jgi:16S rRNA (guanine527-N7)-methyltransferase
MNVDKLLRQYVALLIEWNGKINLVHSDTLQSIFKRHIRDSLQIAQFLDKNDHIIDIGSGAGFPGIILAICGFKDITLYEKNHKKYTFLLTVKSNLGLKLSVNDENVYKMSATRRTFSRIVLISRAFGQLKKLLGIMERVGADYGVFHKGARHQQEIDDAQRQFMFKYQKQPSRTSEDGMILKIYDVRRKLTTKLGKEDDR